MTQATAHTTRESHMNAVHARQATIPAFDRLQYFYGQLLGARDFQLEQAYFREKLKLHNRCLHGYGVVCGLHVTADIPPEECDPGDDETRRDLEEQIRTLRNEITPELKEKDPERYGQIVQEVEALMGKLRAATPAPRGSQTLVLEPGLALDCEGNELVVREPIRFDPWKQLSRADRREVEDGETKIYVTLCFHEQPIEPTRPALADPCGSVSACTYGKVRDSVRLGVTVERPAADTRCETCCGECEECCLLLAEIGGYARGRVIGADDIDMSVRRELGTQVPATVDGISWTHGGDYSPDDARRILGTNGGTDGLELHFSRRVHAADLRDPVLQINVTERGRGRSANVYELAGEFVDVPSSGFVKKVRYRQTSGETLQDGDLVLVTLRAPMILDDCCRPLHGLNVGGRVPLLPDYEEFRSGDPPDFCESPPFRAGGWTTYGLGNFESWFFIRSTEGSQ
jgi:hypothetical protein